MLSFRIFGFSGLPRFFASCWHSYPDLSDFRISRGFLQVADMVARIFLDVRFSRVFCRFRDWLVGVLPFASIGGGRPMVAELSDFRIFGFPDVFCRLLAELPGSCGFSDFPVFFADCCPGCPNLYEFSDFPRFFAGCCHDCSDLSEFADFPRFVADSGIGWSVYCHFHH